MKLIDCNLYIKNLIPFSLFFIWVKVQINQSHTLLGEILTWTKKKEKKKKKEKSQTFVFWILSLSSFVEVQKEGSVQLVLCSFDSSFWKLVRAFLYLCFVVTIFFFDSFDSKNFKKCSKILTLGRKDEITQR